MARSRIKRVVREAFRLNPERFPPGWDFVVIAREGADKLTMQQATDELLGALKRLHDVGKPRPPRPGPVPGTKPPPPKATP